MVKGAILMYFAINVLIVLILLIKEKSIPNKTTYKMFLKNLMRIFLFGVVLLIIDID